MKISNLILPAILVAVIALIYFTYFAPSKELVSLSKFNPGSEINQEMNAAIVKGKGFEKDANDKNGVEVQVSSHEPILAEIANAEVIEWLGYMHGNHITASKISIIK